MIDVGGIMAYESGELDFEGSLALFSELIESGAAWNLQGHYGRTAAGLIAAGYIAEDGTILDTWDNDQEACRTVFCPNTLDGEGWDGLCGMCADRQESDEDDDL